MNLSTTISKDLKKKIDEENKRLKEKVSKIEKERIELENRVKHLEADKNETEKMVLLETKLAEFSVMVEKITKTEN